MPMFYFALYRNEGTLHFEKNLRRLSLAAAFVFGFFVAAGLPGSIRYFGSYWSAISTLDWRSGGATSILAVARDPRTISQISTLLGLCSSLCYVLLLVAFFRQTDVESSDSIGIPVSRRFSFVTKAALIIWSVWIAVILVRVVTTPLLRTYTLNRGLVPPPLSRMMPNMIQTLLIQACIFVAPYVIYNSWLRSDEVTDELRPAPVAPSRPNDAESPSETDGI